MNKYKKKAEPHLVSPALFHEMQEMGLEIIRRRIYAVFNGSDSSNNPSVTH